MDIATALERNALCTCTRDTDDATDVAIFVLDV
jgi:hypothetical protein